MLKVSDINVYYGNIHAIKDISFEVAKGEIVSLIGANGAGKSTILKTVSGLLRTKTGSITFLDGDIRTAAPNHIVKLGLAHVPEGRRIFLQMTVQENLEMGAYTQKPTALSADLENVYERFPRLRERRRQVAGTLSGGEQQMLAMGRALMSRRWGLRPSWWSRSSTSSRSCTAPGRRSCWSSRTRRWRFRSRTGRMCSRRGGS